ncbi:MAG: SdpI family protein [Ruminococcaceae bacterium]|nr:SdpI family protein [Oscillospiraceae bacterium]
MDALKSLFSDFDFAAFIPELDTVLGWVELVARLAVMAAPLVILGFGLLYLLNPPKEANHGVGFRCWWGMSSLDAWRFTQRLAGLIWSGLGLLLTVIMALICNGFHKLEPMAMVERAGACLLWELGLVAASCIAINVVVIVVFDKDGYRRKAPPEE